MFGRTSLDDMQKSFPQILQILVGTKAKYQMHFF